MSASQTPKPFGVIKVPLPSINENTATYTVTKELAINISSDIVAYYTFPGLVEHLEQPSVVKNVNNESYLSITTDE